MNSDAAITLRGVGKCYPLAGHPARRMWNLLLGRAAARDGFWALRGIDLSVRRGEAIGIVGHNGAGKSTLLQIVAGTMAPSEGEIQVSGRIAALLELGAGFNPEFSGRENVFLTAAVYGLSRSEIEARFADIVAFSGVADFIDQPVKTYSSGMLVRLAFSVAVHVDPEVLIIDEALSVGDGEFSRRSFDRIMHFREAGKTLLFCSHSLYQVEALCDRAVWLDHGALRMQGAPSVVTVAYDAALRAKAKALDEPPGAEPPAPATAASPEGYQARIQSVKVFVNGREGQPARTRESLVEVRIEFSAHGVPVPSVAVAVMTSDGRCVTSSSTLVAGIPVRLRPDGFGQVAWTIDALPLLKGEYFFDVYLMCERGLHVYEFVQSAAVLRVEQCGLEQGLVHFPHTWESPAP
jgi:lipopolysaccharide transport system ATP-binding protein